MKKRVSVDICGVVQGVGFRPYIYRMANSFTLNGFVCNNGDGVKIELEGDLKNIDNFFKFLNQNLPPLARIDSLIKKDIELKNDTEFLIVNSKTTNIKTLIPNDISICKDCLDEMEDSSNRRYKYPFINCTNCGVRYTIIDSLPYDRAKTSMSKFKMCKNCEDEYKNPENRRYHAQPTSCFECGPKLSLVTKDLNYDYNNVIDKIVQKIKDGESVAIKGVGGFHLVCDATNDKAVNNLRDKKQRLTKPFAVIVDKISTLENIAYTDKKEIELLESKERPVVLLDKKDDNILSDFIAPNIDKVGIFLPYTPLHILILEKLKKPIVATSANISSEPIIVDEVKLFSKLSHIVDMALTYDRDILHRCDDSVSAVVDGKTIFYRLGRGYTPISLHTKTKSSKRILALGANQKSNITLYLDGNLIHSPYIGDLNSLETIEYFEKTVENFKKFYDFTPDIIVCDKHPNYESTKYAKNYKEKNPNVEIIFLQHHYAHALSVMAEKQIDKEVLAFCFDGTGYGDDGKLWGGEILIASTKDYKRVGHFKEFLLLGGEKAIKEPNRVALSLLFDIFSKDEILKSTNNLVKSYSQLELHTLHTIYTKKLNAPASSSVGRIFDAIFAFMDLDIELSYEGESGLIIESYCDDSIEESYSFSVVDGVVEYKEMILEIIKEKDSSLIASKFLNTLAEIVLYFSKEYKNLDVILCGGVFQNVTLLKKVIRVLDREQVNYHIQNQTSLNDGSISLGQAYFATYSKKD